MNFNYEARPTPDQPPLTQHERLQLTSDTILSAADTAAFLRANAVPDSSWREYSLSDTLHPEDVTLPYSLTLIDAPLSSITIGFEDERSTRSRLSFQICFANKWIAVISRAAYTDTATPFEGEIVDLSTQDKGPAVRESTPPYPLTIDTSEVTTLTKSILNGSYRNVPLDDPQDPAVVALIQDVLRESRGALVTEDLEYSLTIDNQVYEVRCTWKDDEIENVEVRTLLDDAVAISEAGITFTNTKLVAQIQFDDFHQGITFFNEYSYQPNIPVQSDDELVRDTLKIMEAIRIHLDTITEVPLEEHPSID
jgi:hypothetical protein